jgi:hypothetical protein
VDLVPAVLGDDVERLALDPPHPLGVLLGSLHVAAAGGGEALVQRSDAALADRVVVPHGTPAGVAGPVGLELRPRVLRETDLALDAWMTICSPVSVFSRIITSRPQSG